MLLMVSLYILVKKFGKIGGKEPDLSGRLQYNAQYINVKPKCTLSDVLWNNQTISV